MVQNLFKRSSIYCKKLYLKFNVTKLTETGLSSIPTTAITGSEVKISGD